MNFQSTNKFATVYIRLILSKAEADGFTRPWQEIDNKYEFDFEIVWKTLRCTWRILQLFSVVFQTTTKFVIVFVRLILGKVEVDGFNGSRQKTDFRSEFLKGFIVKIEIIAMTFVWISKQKVNLTLFLLDWFYRMLGLTDLPGHDGKVTSDKKMSCNSYQRHNGGNRDYCNYFSVVFKTSN